MRPISEAQARASDPHTFPQSAYSLRKRASEGFPGCNAGSVRTFDPISLSGIWIERNHHAGAWFQLRRIAATSRAARKRTVTLATFLPYRLNVLATVVSSGLARIYSERFEISIPEWRILATVGEFTRITAKDIGLHSEMGKVKVSRAASALEKRGYIARETNSDDAREMFLTLTPKGQNIYDEIVPLALDYAGRLADDLSSDEQAMLDILLSRLMARARKELDGPDI